MRAIEQKMNQAIHRQVDWRLDNTSVEVFYSGVHHTPSYDCRIEVKLHGNLIATIHPFNNTMRISSCGWRTATTKSRLNAILRSFSNTGIYQSNFDWYIGDEDFEDGMTVSFRN